MLTLFDTSDGVLNPLGVRFGSGEIYGALKRPVFPYASTMRYAWASPQDNGERVQLFVKMRAGHKLDPPFEEAIRATIRTSLNR